MKIDVLGVQALIGIAEHGGFQKAADALHITQTALTRRLQNLESFLGAIPRESNQDPRLLIGGRRRGGLAPGG